MPSGNCEKIQKLWYILFTVLLKCAGKDNFEELIILIPKVFLNSGVATKEFPIRIMFISLDKKVAHFKAAICLVENHFLHGVTSSYNFWYTLRKL